MAKKNFMDKLMKLEGAVDYSRSPYSDVISSPSPSFNFTYGNTWGLPCGYTQILYGPPKGGKTVMANSMIGQLHRDDPEAFVVKFDTELRENAQMTPAMMSAYGIDRKRYICYSVNNPALVFDRIEKELPALCDDGMPLKLVIIDSITSIQGRRAMNADTIMTQQIGDDAKTLQDGLKRILPFQRKYNFALIVTSQIRAELDQLEIMRGNKYRMAAAFGVKHFAEYFTFLEPLQTKEGKTDLLGNKFEDDSVSDMNDNSEKTGHKIRVTMKDASMGPKGRVGIVTLDYRKGIINQHEEVFQLGVNRGVIERPNNLTYAYKEKKWTGKPAMLEALKDPALASQILGELRSRDAAGVHGQPVENEKPSVIVPDKTLKSDSVEFFDE